MLQMVLVALALLAGNLPQTYSFNRWSPGTTLPPTCVQVGDTFVKTDATAGAKVYVATDVGPPCVWEQQTGTASGGVPSGLITFVVSGSCPTGWTEVTALNGVALRGTLAANGDVGAATGADSATPTVASTSLTAAAQAFTGSSATTSAVSAGTPAGSVAWPAGVPTNAGGAFSEGAISWPAGVPTHSGTTATFTGNAVTAASTTSGTKLVTGNTSTGVSPITTATGTVNITSQGTIAWPAGVPTIAAGIFTQPAISWPAGVPAFSGNALGTHQHTLTATGTNAASAVSGTITMNSVATVPSSIKVIFCSKD